jgi:hypothetical protein
MPAIARDHLLTSLPGVRAPAYPARDWLALDRAPAPVPVPGPVPQALFMGTAGDDNFDGTAGDDGFDMGQGGDDTVNGKGGMDIFLYEETFTADDKIDGGGDPGGFDLTLRDSLYLNGDYSAGVAFKANTVTDVENIYLTTGNSYRLVLHDNTIDDAIMAIRGGTLGAGDTMIVDNSAATDGTLLVFGGAGKDSFKGGASNESYQFSETTLQKADRLDGGGAIDSIVLNGDFSGGFSFGAKTLKSIEQIYTTFGNDYVLATVDENIAAGSRMIVYGSPLGAGTSLTFDGSAELDGYFLLLGGPESDVLTGGNGNDEIQGNAGGDLITPGKGNDDILYSGPSESGGNRYDWIFGFDFDGVDQFRMDFVPAAIDAKINSGSLSPLTFEADLVAAVNAGNLAAGHAVLFTPDAGGLAGERFLVVDVNGAAGFQSGGVDWVVRLTDSKHLSALDTTDFTLPL